jgi:hypothetical protein
MKIVHLSTDDITGGAAWAAYRLHWGLQQAGPESSMFVETRCGQDSSVTAFGPPTGLALRVRRRLRRKLTDHDVAKYRQSRPADFLALR